MELNTIMIQLQEYRGLIATLAAFLIVLAIIQKWGESIVLQFALWWTRRPFRSFSLPTLLIPDESGWFHPERALCAAYDKLLSRYHNDSSAYDNSASYLRKVDELGRKPPPPWAWLNIGFLVLAESVFFGMVAADLGLDSVTPNNQPFYAAQIGAVLAIVLMLATHMAGREWHRNELIAKAGKLSKEGIRNGSATTASALPANKKVSVASDNLDDHKPVYEQLLNRIHTNYELSPDWRWVTGTLIVLVIIMVLSFAARLSVSDFSAYMEGDDSFVTVSGSMGESFGGLIPDEKPDAPDYVGLIGKLAALLIFPLLFLGIQAISIYMGREYGFAGIESADAYNNIKAFRTKQDYLNHHKAVELAIVNAAQERLNALQEQIMVHITNHGIDADAFHYAKTASTRTFLSYIHQQRQKEPQP